MASLEFPLRFSSGRPPQIDTGHSAHAFPFTEDILSTVKPEK
jgi:hypothetical protein